MTQKTYSELREELYAVMREFEIGDKIDECHFQMAEKILQLEKKLKSCDSSLLYTKEAGWNDALNACINLPSLNKKDHDAIIEMMKNGPVRGVNLEPPRYRVLEPGDTPANGNEERWYNFGYEMGHSDGYSVRDRPSYNEGHRAGFNLAIHRCLNLANNGCVSAEAIRKLLK